MGRWGTKERRREFADYGDRISPGRYNAAVQCLSCNIIRETLMSLADPPPTAPPPLVQRVWRILRRPAHEWDVIEAEAGSIGQLYRRYVCVLAAIPVLSKLIGGEVFGRHAFGLVYHPPLLGAVISAGLRYGLVLLDVFILALAIDALTTAFGGRACRRLAFRVAAYSATAWWVAGVFALYPPLFGLAWLAAAYGIYALHLGLPKLMKTPPDLTLGFTAVTVLAALLILTVTGLLVGAVGESVGQGVFGARQITDSRTGVSGSITLSGGPPVDLGRLKSADAGGGTLAPSKVASVDTLRAWLPTSLPDGLKFGAIVSGSENLAGVTAVKAQAVYGAGDRRVTVSITDLGAAAPLVVLGRALNFHQARQTETGYQKVGRADGRLISEQFDRSNRSGAYAVVVADRFLVRADGIGVDMSLLKAAAERVGYGRLEAWVKADGGLAG